MAMWTERLQPLILERKATFFEATTAIAFADFAARGAEIVVAEVGLGGRLDSTNVLRPLVSAVTKIERDHMKYLGDTLELIAARRRGSPSRGCRSSIGERDPALVDVLRREARKAVARGQADGRGRRPGAAAGRTSGRGPLSLAGPHQRRNAAVAHGILMALPAPYRPAADGHRAPASRRAQVPGRLDRRGKWLFDVAHNPDGIRALVTAHRRPATAAGRCTRWSRSWATRSGPRCWCSSTG